MRTKKKITWLFNCTIWGQVSPMWGFSVLTIREHISNLYSSFSCTLYYKSTYWVLVTCPSCFIQWVVPCMRTLIASVGWRTYRASRPCLMETCCVSGTYTTHWGPTLTLVVYSLVWPTSLSLIELISKESLHLKCK